MITKTNEPAQSLDTLPRPGVAIPLDRWLELIAIESRLNQATVLEEYSGTDGRRQWAHHASTWLYPGDKIVIMHDGSSHLEPQKA